MSNVLLSVSGGHVILPSKVLCHRADGGHLIVNPPRDVWERNCLSQDELKEWALLVAATGRAMIETLPMLSNGCLNYWEAGNWSLNEERFPPGPKIVQQHRRVHMHIFGRSRSASDPDWKWGEPPRFPEYSESDEWVQRFDPLAPDECNNVVDRIKMILSSDARLPPFPAST